MSLKDSFSPALVRILPKKGGKERHFVQSAVKGNMKGET
jgi:hypothetical protein